MIDPRTNAIEVSKLIDAPPEVVFAYLTDPQKFAEWMGVGAELDPRPGGAYRIVVSEKEAASGEYQVVEPPHRLVLTWGWERDPELPPGSTVVEITLTPRGEGTELVLRHSGLPNATRRDQHAGGWALYLGRLEARFGSGRC